MSKEELLELIDDLEERVSTLEAMLSDIDEENGVNDFRISELETFVENVKNS